MTVRSLQFYCPHIHPSRHGHHGDPRTGAQTASFANCVLEAVIVRLSIQCWIRYIRGLLSVRRLHCPAIMSAHSPSFQLAYEALSARDWTRPEKHTWKAAPLFSTKDCKVRCIRAQPHICYATGKMALRCSGNRTPTALSGRPAQHPMHSIQYKQRHGEFCLRG